MIKHEHFCSSVGRGHADGSGNTCHKNKKETRPGSARIESRALTNSDTAYYRTEQRHYTAGVISLGVLLSV